MNPLLPARDRKCAASATGFFFVKLLVDDSEGAKVAGAVLRELWATLLAKDFRQALPETDGSSRNKTRP